MSCSCPIDPEPRRSGVSRRMIVAGGLAAGLAPLLPRGAGAQAGPSATSEGSDSVPATRDFGFLPPRPKTEKHIRPMMFPILPDATLGKATWSDTFLAPRPGGRLHEGQDLMGKKMLKLLAVTNGTIVELRHRSSGNSLYLKGDDDWYYCYVHINNDDPGTDNSANQFKYAFAPGLAVGKRVLKGDLLAYNGDSGNAEAIAPQCHFEIRMPNAKWYNAAAVNPAYSLEASEPAKLRATVPNSAFAPLPNAPAFAKQQTIDFLGLSPSAAWIASSAESLEGGVVTPDKFTSDLLSQAGATKVTAPMIRLYLGFFLRIPDYSGLDYWIRKVRAGTSLDTAASQFAAGSEFVRTYGELDNTEYVSQLYRNLFGREPDPSGLDYWKRRLDGGSKRGWVMRQLCESPEYQRKTDAQVRVLQAHAAMVKASPTPAEYKRWTDWITAAPNGTQDLVKFLRTGTAYAARF